MIQINRANRMLLNSGRAILPWWLIFLIFFPLTIVIEVLSSQMSEDEDIHKWGYIYLNNITGEIILNNNEAAIFYGPIFENRFIAINSQHNLKGKFVNMSKHLEFIHSCDINDIGENGQFTINMSVLPIGKDQILFIMNYNNRTVSLKHGPL